MYLFVYIFLMISLVGLFSQLTLLQAAAEKQLQVAAGQVMYTWHSGAFDLARNGPLTLTADSVCSLTPGDSVAACAFVLYDPSHAVPEGYPPYKVLPAGYNFGLKFRSQAYNTETKNYVVTFLEPGKVTLGFSVGEVMAQIKRTKIPQTEYGQVVTGTCDTHAGQIVLTDAFMEPETGSPYRICYPVPAGIPTGSIAFVSML